jgi:hypothetical protein
MTSLVSSTVSAGLAGTVRARIRYVPGRRLRRPIRPRKPTRLTPARALTRKVPANTQSGAMRKTVNSTTAPRRSLRTNVTRDQGPRREIHFLDATRRTVRAGP